MTIKEPTETQFRAFKKDFLQKKSQQYYDADVKSKLDEAFRIIGKLQSEIDEYKHKIECLSASKKYNYPNALRGKLNRSYAKYAIASMLNELLFNDLKQGKFYFEE